MVNIKQLTDCFVNNSWIKKLFSWNLRGGFPSNFRFTTGWNKRSTNSDMSYYSVNEMLFDELLSMTRQTVNTAENQSTIMLHNVNNLKKNSKLLIPVECVFISNHQLASSNQSISKTILSLYFTIIPCVM